VADKCWVRERIKSETEGRSVLLRGELCLSPFLCFSIQLLCVYCVLIHLVHAKYVVNRLPHNLIQRGLPEAYKLVCFVF